MNKIGDGKKENLGTIQKGIEEGAGKVPHTTINKRNKVAKQTLGSLRIREHVKKRLHGAQKSSTERVLKKQARTARDDHLVKCNLMPGNSRTKRKPLAELYVNGGFTEDSEEWQQELLIHCEGVYTDPDETREVQENGIEYFKRKGDRHFTDDGRGAEITIDLGAASQSKDD